MARIKSTAPLPVWRKVSRRTPDCEIEKTDTGREDGEEEFNNEDTKKRTVWLSWLDETKVVRFQTYGRMLEHSNAPTTLGYERSRRA